MPDPRHLANAPITEAIIDWRVKARPALQAHDFRKLKDRLHSRFPKMEERKGYRTHIHVEPEGRTQTHTHELGLQGYFFRSADETEIVQFRTDGFTFNRLKPYTSFDRLFPMAMEMWRIYCEVARPESVTRLALRYINHVPLPPSMRDFDDYLRAAPVIPRELPQYLGAFFSRMTIHDPDRDIAANILQALETKVSATTVILDIDAYKAQQDVTALDEPEIEETFRQLRVFKNQVFFNMLTEETLRQFE